jgi:hypothetical protein
VDIERVLLETILPQVQKPARYLGTEWNAVHKNWDDVSVRMAFAFPDLYEVGMSHLGLQILYGLVNSQEDYLMERVFAPAPGPLYALRLINSHYIEFWYCISHLDENICRCTAFKSDGNQYL